MKRQIIKTKPVGPYRIMRIVFAVIIAVLLVMIAFVWFTSKPHASHASAVALIVAAVERQDLPIFDRNSQTPVLLT